MLHAQENLGLDVQHYGFVLMGVAAGGIVAGLFGDRVIARFGARRTMMGTLMFRSTEMLAFPLMPNGLALGLCFFAMEVGEMTWKIASVSLRQRLIPNDLRGRVNSIYRLSGLGDDPGWRRVGKLERCAGRAGSGRAAALTLPLWMAGVGQILVCLAVLVSLSRAMKALPRRKLQE